MSRITIYEEWVQNNEIEDKLLLVSAWVRDGLTMKQVASNLGITTETLYQWKKRYSDFSDAIKKNREVADIEVENALNKSARGYEYIEEVPFKLKRVRYEDRKRIEEEYIETVKINKHMPAVPMAQMYWLNNRRPEKWRNKRSYELYNETEDIDKLDEEIFNE